MGTISGANPLWLIPVVALLAGAGGLLLFAARKKKAAVEEQAGEKLNRIQTRKRRRVA
jgi:cytochrome c-type biogenesis protein CcmH/NrfF